ncbi:FMN-binding negative transcriptional regulator [Pannonibacter phragmitetus]|uniref:FMN-binding negative transcriptional regulator n=1 Tax=Pannonibacter phragmitetus TaxID=121719 RepID=UPI003D2F1C3B
MYTPAHFAESDPDEIERLISAHPLAAVVALTPDGLCANHLPLLRAGSKLIGHVALANVIHEDVADGAPVLAIFQGGDAYVSPNWYPSKAETHRAVPTWNYQVIHVHGHIRWLRDGAAKRRIVSLLTSRHEKALNGEGGWKMGDAPADYLEDMISKIVALEISIGRIEAKSKLNQNHPEANRRAVAEEFAARGKEELAGAMRRRGGD